MKKITFLIVMTALIGMVSANELKGQNYAAPYMLFSNSAEAAGYGEAFTTLASDASAAFWNPAGLAHVTNYSFTTTSALGLPFDRQFHAANAALFVDGVGTIGVSATLSGVNDIMGYTDQGIQTGAFDVRNVVLGLSYARFFGEHLSAGITARYINQDLNVLTDRGYSLDLGVRYDREILTLGVSVQSIAGELGPDTLPTILRGGIGLRPIDNLHVVSDFVVEGLKDDDVARRYTNFGIGYDLNFGDTILVPRMGLNNGNLSLGGGVGYSSNSISFRVDYAFVNEASDLFGTSHRIGLVITGL